MKETKDEYFYDYRSFENSLFEEFDADDRDARNIVNKEFNIDKKMTENFVAKAKKESKKYLSFKSSLPLTEITMDRDLCVEAMKQDLSIENEIVHSKQKIDNIKDEIYGDNRRPFDYACSKISPFEEKHVWEKSAYEKSFPLYVRPKQSLHRIFNFDETDATGKTMVLGIFLIAILSLAVGFLHFLFNIEDMNVWAIALVEFIVLFILNIKSRFTIIFRILAVIGILPLLIGLLIININITQKNKKREEEYYDLFEERCLSARKENYENYNKYVNAVEDARNNVNLFWEETRKDREERTSKSKTEIKYLEILIEEMNVIKEESNKIFKCPEKYNTIEIKEKLLYFLENFIAYNLADAIKYYEQKVREELKDQEEREFRRHQANLLEKEVRIRENMAEEQKKSIEEERIANERHRQEQMAKLEEVNRQMAAIKDQNKDIINRQEKLKQEVADINSPSAYGHYVELSSMDINSIADEVAKKL